MPELNVPSCPTHGTPPRSLHTHNFAGIVQAAEAIIETVSGVGTVSYSRCPYGYGHNFEGVVRVLEDLNTTISGIQSGGGGNNILAGSGIYLTSSGSYDFINADYGVIVSGVLVAGSFIDFDYLPNGHLQIESTATISGVQSAVFVQDTEPAEIQGSLWFDTSQGRLFVYASGSTVPEPAWYQTNTEAIVNKSDTPPSGNGLNAPPRDGSIWFNNLMGNLFIYDASTSGWYEAAPQRSFAYGDVAPAPGIEGVGWYNTNLSSLQIWTGSSWVSV